MECKYCKREIEENSVFCNWCGAKQLQEKRRQKQNARREITVPKPRQLPSGRWNIPVSYTHLDVYKRQVEAQPDLIPPGVQGAQDRHQPLQRPVVPPGAQRLRQLLGLGIPPADALVKLLQYLLQHLHPQQLRLLLIQHPEIRGQASLPLRRQQVDVYKRQNTGAPRTPLR